MWNDEDNNPYGSFERRDSDQAVSRSTNARECYGICHINRLGCANHRAGAVGFDRPSTPPSTNSSPRDESPELVAQSQDLSDVEYDDQPGHRHVPPKKGGYDSRIEQILYENPDMPILITDAGKNVETGGKYIAYTIRTGVGHAFGLPKEKTKRSIRIWRSAGDIQSSLP